MIDSGVINPGRICSVRFSSVSKGEPRAALKVVLLAVVLLGLIVLISCKDSHEDEKRTSSPNRTAQTANQKLGEKPDAEEGEQVEEGPATSATVAAEKTAPQPTSGKQFTYNFDGDTPGQIPSNFHGAKTGVGAQEGWVVLIEPDKKSHAIT